jgi:DNA-binding NtrC family response regulator
MLMDHFLQTFSPRFKKKVTEVSEEARNILLQYPYPGNVRELRNIVEYAVNICEGNRILPEHLPAYILEYDPDEQEINGGQNGGPEHPSIKPAVQASDMSWMDTERKMIMDAMVQAHGRRGEVARILGCGRSTLWRKLKRYGLVT